MRTGLFFGTALLPDPGTSGKHIVTGVCIRGEHGGCWTVREGRGPQERAALRRCYGDGADEPDRG